MLNLKAESRFKRDLRDCEKKHWDMLAIKEVINLLISSDEAVIPPTYKDHALTGVLMGKRSLHINNAKQPKHDKWVLLYEIVGDTIVLLRTGTHDEVYGK